MCGGPQLPLLPLLTAYPLHPLPLVSVAIRTRLAQAVDAENVTLDQGVGTARKVIETQPNTGHFNVIGLLLLAQVAGHQRGGNGWGLRNLQHAALVAALQSEQALR